MVPNGQFISQAAGAWWTSEEVEDEHHCLAKRIPGRTAATQERRRRGRFPCLAAKRVHDDAEAVIGVDAEEDAG